MTRRICVVTGTRAEFGLLRWVMQGIAEAESLELQVVATGMHLSPEYGLTYHEIEAAGFGIDARVEMLLGSDTSTAVTKSMGLGMIGFADVFERLAPDLVLVLGDRFEILAAAAAALIARIPLAHLHGGEKTEGAFDEAIRHSITKMAHLHFVAAEEYRNRVIQMGEYPDRVFNVGGLGVDAIKRLALLPRDALEADLGFELGPRSLLVTFHPVTLEGEAESIRQMQALLDALDTLDDVRLVFTLPNADTGGKALARLVERFVAHHPRASHHASLGQLRYLSLLAQVDAVVGNSSSGLAEAPTFGVPTVNIGDRQKGRLQAPTVINSVPEEAAILAAIRLAFSSGFRRGIGGVVNPYGDGGAASRIVDVLSSHPLSDLLAKRFHDLPAQDIAKS